MNSDTTLPDCESASTLTLPQLFYLAIVGVILPNNPPARAASFQPLSGPWASLAPAE